MTDRRLILAAAFLRATTTGFVGVAIGLYLARLGRTPAEIGAVVSAGLAGATAAAIAATLWADRIGRRRVLLATALLGAAGAAAFVFARSPLALAVAAFVGMLNGMGRDRGAALILEQAALPATTDAAGRTRAFAWYTMLQDLGHGFGALLAGIPPALPAAGTTAAATYRAALLACAVVTLAIAALYLRLGTAIERDRGGGVQRLSERSRAVLLKISALFGVDSLAGGFLTTALLSYFFLRRFGVTELAIGVLFFAARLLNAASHLAAAWLAGRIGLVNTMVFTHIPSSLLLATVAFAPSFTVAAVLLLLREGLVEMDVPTRQSYVLAVVEPGERTIASGVTNLVRLAAWAVAPAFAGALMRGESLHWPLVIGAAMKIAYDLLLWRAFRAIKPPEEIVRAALLVGIGLLLAAVPAGAQEARDRGPAAVAPPRVAAPLAPAAPVLDGRPDEPEWQAAGVIADLPQQSPRPGEPSPYHTEVWFLVTPDALWVASSCGDPETARIAVHTMQRDGEMDAGDVSYSVTPQLVGVLPVNTNFAETETTSRFSPRRPRRTLAPLRRGPAGREQRAAEREQGAAGHRVEQQRECDPH